MKGIWNCAIVLLVLLFCSIPVQSQSNLTKDAGNPVLGAGPSGTWDSWGVHSAAIIFDGTIYQMWFTGADGSPWYSEMGYAISADGRQWTKDTNNPVFKLGPAGSWDSRYVGEPYILYINGEYKMWYNGDDGSNSHKIGLATSSNGIDWVRFPNNPILTPDATGIENRHVHRPSVIFDGNTYQMWYEFRGDSNGSDRIGYATSVSGEDWVKHPGNPVLDVGSAGEWDQNHVGSPSVVWDDSQYVMLYRGHNGNHREGIAYSDDGINWQKYSNNPVLDLGDPGTWDDEHVTGAHLMLQETVYKVWYNGNRDGSHTRIGYAEGPVDQFTRVITGDIVNQPSRSGAASWGDYNNDTYIDLFVANEDNQNTKDNYLYENNGNGTFTRVVSGDIVNNLGDSRGSSWGDYDNDGFLDLVVANGGGQNSFLYRNNGDDTFTRNTAGPVVNDNGNSDGAAWGDYDNDGNLDLFVTNYSANNALFKNNGDGTFTKILTGAIVSDGGFSGAASWCDFDNDGNLDLLVTNGGNEDNFLYFNNGDGTFAKITSDDIINNDGENSGGISYGDYDNDGYEDVFIAHWGRNNALFKNNGDRSFTKIITGPIINDADASLGSGWADYDNDGDKDLFVANHNLSNNFLYENNGDNTFTKITQGSIVTDGGYSVGASWADYDNDGDLDLFVANQEDQINYLYRNTGNANNWINMKLIGTISNTAAIGAKVWVQATLSGDNITQVVEISGGGTGYRSQNSLNAEFGLGDAVNIAGITIEWPSGIVWDTTNVAVNQFLTIIEREPNQPPNCSGAAIADQSADANCQASITEADVTGVTDPDGDPLTITVNPTTLVLGANSVSVTADDGNGGTCSTDITVNVVDNTAPVPDLATLPDATGECSVMLSAPMATDNCAGSIAATTSDPMTYTAQGTFVVTWTYDDGNGNSSQQVQSVIVDDVTAPVISLNGVNPLTLIRFSGPYVEPGAVVTDNCNANTPLVISGTVDTNLPGSYPVTYNADDGNGHSAQVIRTVNVIDDPNVLTHTYLYLADTKIMLDKMGQSDGDLHSNDKIDIKKGPATYSGNVTAVDKIDIDKDVTIDGNVTAGGELKLKNNVTITGTAIEFASVSAMALPILSYSAGGNDVKVMKNQTQALTPGSYGKIKVEEKGTLQLSSGDYFFEKLILKKDVILEISLDTGQVTMNVVEKVDIDKDARMSLSPLGDVDSRYVTINSMEDIQFGEGSILRGTFNAPSNKVHLKKESDLLGSICAKEIDVDKDAVAVHHDAQSMPATAHADIGGEVKNLNGDKLRVTQATGDSELGKITADASGSGAVTAMPDRFALGQNYPNPFNPSTTITFDVPEASEVTLAIYNLRSQLIQTLHSGVIAAGQHSIVWNGRDFRGAKVASGIYLYQLKANGFVATRKLILTK